MPKNKTVFVLDVDGVVTPGTFVYTSEGKIAKIFGADDYDMLAELKPYMDIHFISGDTKGFAITYKRLAQDCGYKVSMVPAEAQQRWQWIREEYPKETIVFMGDGCRDYVCLQQAAFSITTPDAMAYNREIADMVTTRTGGYRAVAEACIAIIDRYRLKTFLKPQMLDACRRERQRDPL